MVPSELFVHDLALEKRKVDDRSQTVEGWLEQSRFILTESGQSGHAPNRSRKQPHRTYKDDGEGNGLYHGVRHC